MNTAVIIQARMGSTRLPGKVMRPLCGRTILGHVLTRVRRCPVIDTIIVATTTQPADEAIVEESRRYGAQVYRGSESDVLSRYYEAARAHAAEVVVRITSDCPLLDPELLAQMLVAFGEYRRGDPPVDYLSNTLRRTYPRGLDLELFTFSALEQAMREAAAPSEREHVTPFIYRHPERFNLRSFERATDISPLRWTLDTSEDWQLIHAVFETLGPRGEFFSTEQVLELMRRRPELAELNANVEQKKLGG